MPSLALAVFAATLGTLAPAETLSRLPAPKANQGVAVVAMLPTVGTQR